MPFNLSFKLKTS